MRLNLIVQTAFLGDLLLSIPLIKRTKKLWPEDQIGLVCRKGFGDFFLKTKLVDFVFEIQKGQDETYQKALAEISKYEVRYLISPHESLRTGFFVRQIEADRKVSYAHLWTLPFYSDRVRRDLRLPDALRQVSLLGSLAPEVKAQVDAYAQYEKPFVTDAKGKLPPPPEWGDMSLRAELMKDTETFPRLKEKFGLSFKNKTVLIFPGSVWATKRWTIEGFISTGQELVKQGYEVIVMGGPGEEGLAEQVAKAIPEAKCLAAKTQIYESAQLILQASLLIGNDSASAHLASACDTPLIAIFGPTVLEFGYRPWSEEAHIIERKGMACRPCGKHGHNECPLKTHACMKEITASEVVKVAQHILR